jgi:hypothetical protein
MPQRQAIFCKTPSARCRPLLRSKNVFERPESSQMSVSRKSLRLSPLIYQNALRLKIIFAVGVAKSTVASK